MDKHEAAVTRGEEAERILNSDVFAQAFEDVRQVYIAALEALPTDESGDEEAKDYRRKLASLSTVRDALTKHIQTGRIAQKIIEKKAARQNITDRARSAVTNLLNRNRSR